MAKQRKISFTERQQEQFEKVLLELTSLPTATGCEHSVYRYLYDWAARRDWVKVEHDCWGNMKFSVKGMRKRRPIVITSHLDHPAFVVVDVKYEGREVWAEFRGGVHDDYFAGTKVRWWPSVKGGDVKDVRREKFSKADSYESLVDARETLKGEVVELVAADEKKGRLYKRAKIHFTLKNKSKIGDVVTWDLPESRVVRSKLHARVCDDLAATAASLVGFDRWYARNTKKLNEASNVQLLFTRAEEVGFVGAIGACQSGIINKDARIIALENSKSDIHDSPQGAGPIVRVGDRMSTFNDELNYLIAGVCEEMKKADDAFCYQRKLMAGGACEATAYQGYGYQATCLCLPLVNYHNMNEAKSKIDCEVIDMADYQNFVKMLVGVCERLDEMAGKPLCERLDVLFASRRGVLA